MQGCRPGGGRAATEGDPERLLDAGTAVDLPFSLIFRWLVPSSPPTPPPCDIMPVMPMDTADVAGCAFFRDVPALHHEILWYMCTTSKSDGAVGMGAKDHASGHS